MRLSVCIYCASSKLLAPIYYSEAKNLAHLLSKNNVGIKFGGGCSGIMGAIADVYINERNEDIVGVIPEFMHQEGWHHTQLKHLIVTNTMHERKQKMIENVDAAIALPGGIGTLEEVLEALTWKQLGIFSRPIILVNINGYFNKLIDLLEHATSENFMSQEHLQLFTVVNDSESVLQELSKIRQNNTKESIEKLAHI
jgi:uncharacterized protein (TIGR00730 family)